MVTLAGFRFSKTKPYVRVVPKLLRPFVQSGSTDTIFRPRIWENGIFATLTGYGVSFALEGVDSEGLDRATLKALSQKVATAYRVLPLECLVYEYLSTADQPDILARPIGNFIVSQQAQDRASFLRTHAKFRSVRLIITLYIPGKVAKDSKAFATQSRAALRKIQSAADLFEKQLRFANIRRLNPDQLTQFYSYLLNLDRSLITHKAALPNVRPKKLGRVHIGVEDGYLRVGKRYGQVLALADRPCGTRPNLWGEILTVDCEQVWCAIWQRKNKRQTRSQANQVENLVGLAGEDLYAAAIGGYNPNIPPPRRASTVAQEKKVDIIGDVHVDLDGRHYYGEFFLYGLIHSRDKEQIEAALPRVQEIFSDPSEAVLMEEKRGAVSAYVSIFPGQDYRVRRHWLRGDHKANLSFIYSPFLGYPWSEDIGDEYTIVYETRLRTPFYFTQFVKGNGNILVLGAPRRGKSLNANAIFTASLKHGGKTFIFDQGGSYESNVLALGGSVTKLGLEYPRINFWSVAATKENIFSIAQTIKLMLVKSGLTPRLEHQDAIEKSVERMFDVPREMRRLKNLALPPELRRGLRQWIDNGIYSSIFDNVEDDLELHSLQLFDFASLSEKHNDLLEVQMSWILLRCQEQIRDPRALNVPKLVLMDELWKRTGIIPVVSFMLETIKADAKNLAWAMLLSHSIDDLGPYAQRIKEACRTSMFMGGSFDRDKFKDYFHMNNAQLDELESLGDREFAVKVDGKPIAEGGDGYFKVLRMNLDPGAYMRATTKPAERALRDRLVAELGQTKAMKELEQHAAAYRGN